MPNSPLYEIFSDGGSRGNPGPGASAFIVYKDRRIIFQHGYFLKMTTNNIAEYFAVCMAVAWLNKNTESISSREVYFYMDSELVVKQLNGLFKIKNSKLRTIYEKIKVLEKKMGEIKIYFHHIPREKNSTADELVNKTVDENTQ
jgi:ribonuclease HI